MLHVDRLHPLIHNTWSLDCYESVSNAKVNIHKTEAFYSDRRSYPEWIDFLSTQGTSQ